jgi:hypothetical protein
VALTGEEIRSRLTAFAARWSVYEGTERSEAQTFLNELFACYGTDRSEVARFEEYQAGRFLDLLWPRVCLIEMKAPGEAKRLGKHREQALGYWMESADPETNTPAPPYVVLCAFSKLEIWEPGSFPGAPRVVLDLIDLPDQYDTLLFLAGREPVFAGGQAELTREAVVHLVDLYEQLSERRAADPDVLRDFLLQCVWCLFAEDLGQIPEHGFMRILDELIANPRRSSEDDLGQLFTCLNTPGDRPEHGLYAGTPYANGGLFENPAHVHLSLDELKHLRDAAQFQWRDVQPSIFGSLLEGGLGHDQQWRLSAHYTHEADIQKVVQPTIVEPWRERIENLRKHKEAVAAQNDLLNYVVLDPACGSGNFLYVAYRELRRLEQRLHQREVELRRKEGLKEQGSLSLHFPLSNLKGIEIESFAVALARVTLWMGHKLAVDELELSESTLPLADLSGIEIGDALRIPWPRADAIIGNPPFHGDRYLRGVLGGDYVEWLKSEFEIGVKDYCVYWFRKAHDQLEDGKRAGLVGTNSISQNRARGVSLDHIVNNGGVIVSAVSSQDWPGEASVDVSIVNWIKKPSDIPSTVTLDGAEVSNISPSLRAGAGVEPVALPANSKIAFQGMLPGANYVVENATAEKLRALNGTRFRDVVRPYLSGDDITSDPLQRPRRFIVDFGTMSLEEAMKYPDALELVRSQAKSAREKSNSFGRNPRWWQFLWPRPIFRERIASFNCYIAGTATGKRILFCWCEADIIASNATNVFALNDHYHLGVLSSLVHTEWAQIRSSTLEDRIRYTPTSAFETFPWPDPIMDTQREQIAELARKIVARRQEICLERQIGLTKLYNEVDDGAFADLAALHRKLDQAVCAAYGWPRSIAGDPDETNARLLALNQEIAAGKRPYDPYAYLREAGV